MTKSQGFFMIAKFWLNWLMDDLPRLGYITKLKNKKRKKKEKKKKKIHSSFSFLYQALFLIILNY